MKRPQQMSTKDAALYRARQLYRQAQNAQAYQTYGTLNLNPTVVQGWTTTVPTTTATTSAPIAWVTMPASTTNTAPAYCWPDTEVMVADGMPQTIRFPDGTVIEVATDGSFVINDKDAKVTYRANRVRDFNPFLNASDKLEAFIQFCGTFGIRQGEMLDIPIKHFIAWLIIEAAKADGDECEVEPVVAELHNWSGKRVARCACGRFMSRTTKLGKVEEP